MNSRQTAALPPVTLHSPRSAPLPLVFDSPHSGFAFPPELAPAAPLTALATSCDAFVDELWGKAPEYGCTLIAATFPRWLIDPNRARDDIDPELLAAPWPGQLNVSDKSRSGMGLIRRLALPGVPVHGRRLGVAEVEGLLRNYYDPYHDAVRDQLDTLHDRFGTVWHVNCHSMKSRGNAMNIDAGRERPDFVVGTRDGSSCGGEFTDCVVAALRSFGYRVNVNDPYKGAELIRRYSNPAAGRHSLQIEVNRALYMDETRRERHQGFAALEANLERLIVVLADFVRTRVTAGRAA